MLTLRVNDQSMRVSLFELTIVSLICEADDIIPDDTASTNRNKRLEDGAGRKSWFVCANDSETDFIIPITPLFCFGKIVIEGNVVYDWLRLAPFGACSKDARGK